MIKKLFIIAAILVFISGLHVRGQAIPSQKKEINEVIAEYINYINADSIQSYMQGLEDFQTRFCLAGNRREVAVWIMERFIGFGYELVRLDSFPLNVEFPRGSGNHYNTWQFNVECTFPGHSKPDQVYILGAHHDAITREDPFAYTPGADDNASGVAAALEIARVMKTHGYIPESTVRFVTFAAEELGLHGAFDYAGKAKASGTNIKLMINNDMISHTTLPESEWAIQLQEYPDARWPAELAKEVINQFTILQIVETNRYIHATDSWAFHKNGFPAIFFIENQFTPFYHTPQDLVASTNKKYAAEATKISLGMLINLNGPGIAKNIYEPESIISTFSNYPNPFINQTTIIYELSMPGNIDLHFHDSLGRQTVTISKGWQQAGRHQVVWDSSVLMPGIYYCRLQSPAGNATIRLVKID